MSSVLIYGDVSLNVIDGSAIWLVSISETLTNIFDEVHVLLKDPRINDRFTRVLDSNSKITVHENSNDPSGEPLTARKAAQRIAGLNVAINPNAIVIRGTDVCTFAVGNKNISKKLWSYVTDLPFPPSKISQRNLDRLNKIATQSQKMFAQTESARSYLEGLCPVASGKTTLLTPMVPDHFYEYSTSSKAVSASLELVYSGKFAKEWKTLEMLDIPSKLRERGINANLTMIGDKFQKDLSDKSWHKRMQEKLESLSSDPMSGIRWAGGLPRDEALRIVCQADIGLSWRSPQMDASLELSTKLLEYSAVGTAVLANRNGQHEDILGSNYPLLLDGLELEDVVRLLAKNSSRSQLNSLGKKNSVRVQHFSASNSSQRLKENFFRSNSLTDLSSEETPLKIVVASHDFKFMGEILEHLSSSPRYELRIDQWSALRDHDEKRSQDLLDWADVIMCEWCAPNAVWYQKNKRPEQKLIVRLHRFEVNGPWMKDLNFAEIDQLVFVSEMQKQATLEKLELEDKSNYIVLPNVIDTHDLDRPKLNGSEFHLGIIGFVPFLKRPDRTLDLLEKLLETDDRYTLHFKGRMPWEYPHEWNKPLQQQLYLDFFSRIRNNKSLQSHISFEPFGADIASWLRNIGILLSPSSYESFHLATAEGMASGALPIIWSRDGAEEIFGKQNVYNSVDSMTNAILRLRDKETREEQSLSYKDYVSSWDSRAVLEKWDSILYLDSRNKIQSIVKGNQ